MNRSDEVTAPRPPSPDPAGPTAKEGDRIASIDIKWWICGLLMFALVLNYMDRQVLTLTITAIQAELSISDSQYGFLQKCFGYAFAFGGLIAGWLADRFSVRLIYPILLLGWSAAGVASGYGDRIGDFLHNYCPWFLNAVGLPGETEPQRAFAGFVVCRIVLGLFEAGQWPCALITTLRLLSPRERPFGNSLLQSGASLGAILTPQVVGLCMGDDQKAWRWPFVAVGAAGILWILPWLWMTGSRLEKKPGDAADTPAQAPPQVPLLQMMRQAFALILVIVSINLTWQFFLAWLPKMLEEYHGYSKATVRNFVSCYYIATDLGCISAGFLVKWLANRGLPLHGCRIGVFTLYAGLTALSLVASSMPAGLPLLIVLATIGFGNLGLFPIYYSLTQDLSPRHQGKVTGFLSFFTWIATAEMQQLVGNHVQATHSYAEGIFWAGLVPFVGLIALALLWGKPVKDTSPAAGRP